MVPACIQQRRPGTVLVALLNYASWCVHTDSIHVPFAVNVLATVVAIVVVDRLGRKFLLIAGVVQMVIAEIVVGVTLKYQFVKDNGKLSTAPSIGVLVTICVFIAGFAWSWGPIGWLYPT